MPSKERVEVQGIVYYTSNNDVQLSAVLSREGRSGYSLM